MFLGESLLSTPREVGDDPESEHATVTLYSRRTGKLARVLVSSSPASAGRGGDRASQGEEAEPVALLHQLELRITMRPEPHNCSKRRGTT